MKNKIPGRWPATLVRLGLTTIMLSLSLNAMAYANAKGGDSGVGPDGLTSWLSNSKVTGQFREYYYTEQYGNILPFKHSNSMGGWLNVHTPGYKGLSLDVGAYTAQSLGLNTNSEKSQIKSLPSSNLTVLGQAYLQYAGHGLKLRAGDQPLNTPFAQTDALDLRMIPPMFQGVGGSYHTPVSGLSLYAYRMFRFKGWDSSGFAKTDTGKNPYNVIAPVPQVSSIGFGAYGAKEHYKNSKLQLWYYDFYNRLRLGYGEYNYHYKLGYAGIKALIFGAQYAKEWNAGSQVAPYQHVNSNLSGVRFGFAVPHNTLLLSYNDVQNHPGDFRGGGFVSPYQLGAYDTPTIYTDVFGVSLGSVVASPGHAYGIKDILKFPGHHLLFIGKYTILDTPQHFVGTSGVIDGVGRAANTWELIGKYGFAPHWSFKFLYASIHKHSKLGTIRVGRLFLTYTFSKI